MKWEQKEENGHKIANCLFCLFFLFFFKTNFFWLPGKYATLGTSVRLRFVISSQPAIPPYKYFHSSVLASAGLLLVNSVIKSQSKIHLYVYSFSDFELALNCSLSCFWNARLFLVSQQSLTTLQHLLNFKITQTLFLCSYLLSHVFDFTRTKKYC